MSSIEDEIKEIDTDIAKRKQELELIKTGPDSHLVILDKKNRPGMLSSYFLQLGNLTPEIRTKEQARKSWGRGALVSLASLMMSGSMTSFAHTILTDQLPNHMRDWNAPLSAAAFGGLYVLISQNIDKKLLGQRAELLNAAQPLILAYHAAGQNYKEQDDLRGKINALIKGGQWMSAAQLPRLITAGFGVAVVTLALTRFYLSHDIHDQFVHNVHGDNADLLAEYKGRYMAAIDARTIAQHDLDTLTAKYGGAVASYTPEQTAEIERLKTNISGLDQQISEQAKIVSDLQVDKSGEKLGQSGTGKVGEGNAFKHLRDKVDIAVQEQRRLEGLKAADVKAIADIDTKAAAQGREIFANQKEGLDASLGAAKQRLVDAAASESRLADHEELAKQDPRYKDPDAPMSMNDEARAMREVIAKSYIETLLKIGLAGSLGFTAETLFMTLIKSGIDNDDVLEVVHRASNDAKTFKIYELGRQIDELELKKGLLEARLTEATLAKTDTKLEAELAKATQKAEVKFVSDMADIQFERVNDTAKAIERLKTLMDSPSIPQETQAAWRATITELTDKMVEEMRASQLPAANDDVQAEAPRPATGSGFTPNGPTA